MRNVAPQVLLLCPDPAAEARVREAVRGRAHVTWCRDLPEARERAALAENLLAVVVAPMDSIGRATSPWVLELTSRMAGLPVVAYCSISPVHRRLMVDLVDAGAHDIIFHELDSSAYVLSAILAEAEQVCAAEAVLAALTPRIPKRLEAFATFAVMYPDRALRVEDVASAVGVTRRTLATYCVEGGVPAPEPLLMWCRLLLAASLLDTTQVSVDRIAMRLHFPSGSAFRNLVKRYTGRTASALRATRAFNETLECFDRAVALRQPEQVAG